ncbi:4Fe-4S dicluster domain-containing protein [Desulforhopalus singaporensis]|uniref:Fe-S-cluster-containing dehydrogenase component n=1 Tax=Desulforhopalus singaporensis TaxID=91360 RepID=A0A1H0V8K1_9BACT|nr:4Fe-4S dicluster domain-containing protein [Desulforhopalus singaporensis]SDP74703.1 Fe-S-cluster-containing dehydrogenase component [Desulforhopalus singaporensis]
MTKQIEINPERCTACRICEFTCSTHNFGEINPLKSRIKVRIISRDFFFYPVVCQQCGKAPCVEVCPKDALSRNETTGAIELSEDDCIGCRLCVKACPFGAMGFSKETRLADKCDLCGGDPECVKHCFYGALEFKEIDKVSEKISMEYIKKIKDAMEEVEI